MADFPPLKRDLATLTIAVALAAPMVAATDFPNSDYLTGNWGGARDHWKEQGVTLNLGYTAEPMANVSGGEVKGGTYADNLGLDLGFDLERLLGIGGTDLLIKVSKRDGLSVSERFVAPSEGGNLFTVQELYGGQNVKLANVQFNTRLLDDRLNLAYGRLIANDDFLRSPLYCQFLNNSFCGSPKPVFLQNPFTFTAYPLATWGARARYDTPARRWTIQAALYDGDPEGKEGDPTSPSHNDHGTSWGFGDNGVTLAGEIHYHVNRDSKDALPGVYKIGGYYMTGEFQNVGRLDNATETGNAMGWVLADQMLYRESAGADRGLSGFGAVVFSLTDDVNPMTWYVNTGLIYEGLFRARPRDTTGLAITSGWFGDRVNVARNAQDLAKKDYEAVIELNHKFVLGHGIAIQPDLQYVIRPAATGDIDNALVIGAKVSVQF
ncbi:carbohydrate porin [uncultured Thiocystis sp.]|jgi:porin|uniref:carbohydrate porin n=1 Tax=uncultured Thiocystis sp. TaxID=1202134 RepID=UPI0025EE47D2|nr:carbohydrate porin [uncultured Thiocystis sp.]